MSTPSFVLELEISFSTKLLNERKRSSKDKTIFPGSKALLDRKINTANSIYNTALNECLHRLHKLQHDRNYQHVCDVYALAVKEDDEQSAKIAGAQIGKIRESYGYTEYAMHSYINKAKHHFNNLGADECQKLATRAFQTVEKVRTGQAKRVHFHKYSDDTSVEGKSHKSTLAYAGDGCIRFGKGNTYPLLIKSKDTYAKEALTHRVKYVRLVRRTIRGKQRYYAQLVLEGIPPKTKNLSYGKSNAKVGLDLGTSTIAVCSKKAVFLEELAPDTSVNEKKLRCLNRAISRSMRATNPDNYNDDGTISEGRKTWVYSNRCKHLKEKRKELYRKCTVHRELSHNSLANKILSLGKHILVEDMRMQALAKRSTKNSVNKKNGRQHSKKRYGKAIMSRAPAKLIEIIDRKLGYTGHSVLKVNTFKVRASQYDHKSNTYKKKQLNDRFHIFSDNSKVQRDLYSAFLIMHVEDNLETINRTSCQRDFKWFKALEEQEVSNLRNNGSKTLRWYVA